MDNQYVLVTAAYNEEKFIEPTLRSIVEQTSRPVEWIVVSDGSTDATDEIVKRYAAEYPFIRLHRITKDHPRNFTAQVSAINEGLQQLASKSHAFVGNLDADITLDPGYFEALIDKFQKDTALGLGGGTIYERSRSGMFLPRKTNAHHSVAHACQLFRRQCFEVIGGAYVPLPYGGPDTVAEVSARMMRWKVQSFDDLKVYHHRFTNGAEGAVKGCFRQGKMDYSLGALPSFELIKIARRLGDRPLVFGAIARFAGFISSYLANDRRAVEKEFITYLRAEQAQRVRRLLRFGSNWQPAEHD